MESQMVQTHAPAVKASREHVRRRLDEDEVGTVSLPTFARGPVLERLVPNEFEEPLPEGGGAVEVRYVNLDVAKHLFIVGQRPRGSGGHEGRVRASGLSLSQSERIGVKTSITTAPSGPATTA